MVSFENESSKNTTICCRWTSTDFITITDLNSHQMLSQLILFRSLKYAFYKIVMFCCIKLRFAFQDIENIRLLPA